MMKERYWRNLLDKKFYLEYLGVHFRTNVIIQRVLSIFLAVISTGSLATLFIWEKYSLAFSSLLVATQVLTAALPYLPFEKRKSELEKCISTMTLLYDELEENFYNALNEWDDEKINAWLYDFNKQWDKENDKFLEGDSLPRKKKYVKIADDATNQYFDLIFGGEV